MGLIDGELRVVGLNEAVGADHDAALGVGEVALRFVGGESGRSGWRALARQLPAPARGRLVVGRVEFIGIRSTLRRVAAQPPAHRLVRVRRRGVFHPRGLLAQCLCPRGTSLGFERRLRLADARKATLAPTKLLRQFVSAHPNTVARILARISCLRLAKQALDLLVQPALLAQHALVAHRLVLARIGLDLGAVNRHMAKLHQPRTPAQLQHLHEQPLNVLPVHLAKLVDSGEKRLRVGANHPKRHVLVAGTLDTPRGVHPGAVGVDQQRHHHRRVVRALPARVLALDGRLDGAEVQLRDHVQNEPCQMPLGQPLAQRRRQQIGLIL